MDFITKVISFKNINVFFLITELLLFSTPIIAAENTNDLTQKFRNIKSVDLTHPLSPDLARPKHIPKSKKRTIYRYEKQGYWIEEYRFAGSWGTHLISPAHYHKDLRTVDEIPPEELLAPLVVIDYTKDVTQNPNFVLTLDHLRNWEKKFGPIPKKSLVVFQSGWSKHWPVSEFLENMDSSGIRHSPGWGIDALRFLVQERQIVGIGQETFDVDSGDNISHEQYPAQTYILGENRYVVSLLTHLDKVPPIGAWVFIGIPKVKRSPTFPTRVIALLP